MQMTVRRWDMASPWLVVPAIMLVVLLAQLPLILNPGYFSHDELQWAVRADAGYIFPWIGTDAFQYRPLTFNLWMWLSRHLFAQPQLFHLVLVAMGATNAALLHVLARRLGAATLPAAIAAVLFALGPYAAYVHGWVGTLGDVVWVGCALLIGLVATPPKPWWFGAFATLVLTATALFAKEAALSIPALALVAWLFDAPRRRQWQVVLLASAVPVLAYLAARYGPLLSAPPQGNTYAWSVAHIPVRWLEYQLFLPNLPVFEVHNALSRGITDKRTLIAAVLWLALLVALSRVGWRWAAAFVAGGIAALGPVLVLGASANQYGYGFAAFVAGLLAVAWPALPRWGRGVALLMAALTTLHGINVMRQMRHVGEVQAVFSPALAGALQPRTQPLRLAPAADAESWIFQRLTHGIPSYRGVPIGDRVQLVDVGEPADLVIQDDGRLEPAR